MTWPEARPPQRTVSLVLKELSAVMTCGQCGQGVVYQGDDAAPSCAECGWQSPTTWRDALIDIFELPKALRARDGNSMLISSVKCQVVTKTVHEVRCPKCDATTSVTGQWLKDAPVCAQCQARFDVRAFDEEIVLLTVPAKGPKTVAAALSLTCSSCGGPLATDGSARTVACQFCQAVNVVPVIAKARTVYDTLYAGLIDDVTEVPRDRAFGENPNEVVTALQQKGYPFPDSQLENILIKHRNHFNVFDEITTRHLRSPAIEVIRQLIGTTDSRVEAYATKRLASHQAALDHHAAGQRAVARKRQLIFAAQLLALILAILGFMALVWLSPSSGD